MRSDPTLKKWFRRYNRKYFDGQLSNRTIVKWRTEADVNREGLSKNAWAMACTEPAGSNKPDQIYFDPLLKRTKWWPMIKATLLHEMTHLKTRNRDNHGKVFDAHMVELAKKGAFHKLW